jgi:hypothetical protein
MMVCGHVANAQRKTANGWLPSCAICDCDQQTTMPDLEERQAICCTSNSLRWSIEHDKLAFFEYRGEGSPAATTTCKHCRYALIAHQRKEAGTLKHNGVCDTFEPIGPYQYDKYYCGCRGWD